MNAVTNAHRSPLHKAVSEGAVAIGPTVEALGAGAGAESFGRGSVESPDDADTPAIHHRKTTALAPP